MVQIPQFSDELAGQEDFFKTYLPLVNKQLTMDSVQSHDNDGQIGDLLIEFKKSITDLNAVLLQCVKYLSLLRIKGYPVPSNILLISLNNGTAYYYSAKPYLNDIEKVYVGGASVGNQGQFISQKPISVWNYIANSLNQRDMIDLMKQAEKRLEQNRSNWLAVHIDSNDIVGWATRFYRLNPHATKAAFLGDEGIIGEIREPYYLKGKIIPYKGKDNVEFGYIMDKLNDDMHKRDLGAYYTPEVYAEKSHELVYDAIRRFQSSKNKDYIILDSSAGTGNLELKLNDNVPKDVLDKDVLSHVIVNTYEYYEYKVLVTRLGDKVRYVNPPTTTFTDGTVHGSDALSQKFLNNPIINQYVDDPKCTIIIYQNPPFAETTSIEHQKAKAGKTSSTWRKGQAVFDSKRSLKGARSNDMANVFIWAAFNYYVRQSTDSVITFSPMKYWKIDDWMNRKFIKGFAFDRHYFHANRHSNNACVLWSAEQDNTVDDIPLQVFDVDTGKNRLDPSDDHLVDLKKNVKVKRIHSLFSHAYYKEVDDPNDIIQPKSKPYPDRPKAIWSAFNGAEAYDKTVSVPAKYNANIIGYLTAQSTTFENDSSMTHLLRNTEYNGHGFHLRADNYLRMLPMFAAGWWKAYRPNWWEIGTVYRSGDGKEKYERDLKAGKLINWLHQVLFYTGLDTYNKIRSLHGSDGRWYYNELTLDNNKGKVDDPLDKSDRETLASRELATFLENMDEDENQLYQLWKQILSEAKETEEYDSRLNYSIYQITQELNTKHEEEQPNGKIIKVPDYPQLNGDLKTMRNLIKDYYHSHIQPVLFEYEFLK